MMPVPHILTIAQQFTEMRESGKRVDLQSVLEVISWGAYQRRALALTGLVVCDRFDGFE
jgi:hypothetical protein